MNELLIAWLAGVSALCALGCGSALLQATRCRRSCRRMVAACRGHTADCKRLAVEASAAAKLATGCRVPPARLL